MTTTAITAHDAKRDVLAALTHRSILVRWTTVNTGGRRECRIYTMSDFINATQDLDIYGIMYSLVAQGYLGKNDTTIEVTPDDIRWMLSL